MIQLIAPNTSISEVRRRCRSDPLFHGISLSHNKRTKAMIIAEMNDWIRKQRQKCSARTQSSTANQPSSTPVSNILIKWSTAMVSFIIIAVICNPFNDSENEMAIVAVAFFMLIIFVSALAQCASGQRLHAPPKRDEPTNKWEVLEQNMIRNSKWEPLCIVSSGRKEEVCCLRRQVMAQKSVIEEIVSNLKNDQKEKKEQDAIVNAIRTEHANTRLQNLISRTIVNPYFPGYRTQESYYCY